MHWRALIFFSSWLARLIQLQREQEGTSGIVAVSAGIFGTQAVTALAFEVNGVPRDGLPFFDPATRIFRYVLPAAVAPGVSAPAAFGVPLAVVSAVCRQVAASARAAGRSDRRR